MIAQFFVDTNVLLYAGSNAPEDVGKRQIARGILARADIGFSAQMLQEFYAAAVSKKRLMMTHDEAVAVLQALSPFPACAVTRELVLDAIQVKQQFRLSYWDSAILAAAKAMGCHTVYSEDLNPGQDYNGMRVVNPFFTGAPSSAN